MKRINQYEPLYTQAEADACHKYIMSGGWLSDFTKTREFEQVICDYTGAKYCVVVCNGTIALMIALMACGIQRCNKVCVPDYTMAATPYSVGMLGGQVQLVDINRDNLHMDWAMVDDDCFAVVPVSIGGRVFKNYAEAMIGCTAYFTIEDACQSLGSWHKGKHLGTFGDIGVLSFNAFKLVSVGQGGALLTDDEDLYERIKRIKDFGRSGGRGTGYDALGINAKFTDLQAVIGIEQMKRIEWRIGKKKMLWRWYFELLNDIEQIKFVPINLNQTTPWYIDILCQDRDKLIAYLNEQGIETQPFYPPIHRLPYYGYLCLKDKQFPNACYVSDNGLWLPSSLQLDENDVDRVCREVRRFYKG